ncbi:thrombospondin-4 [Caerostris extrusa]|uniref:Thrombospondin-4 n=1 Tax=Caerostris extrusa TaxID=172846 RepID=A0AAV4NID3_CAEEX|nr:thrombospondin-4 [Caerostris extrusa]
MNYFLLHRSVIAKVKVQVIRNSSLQRALEEANCPPADAQAIQPTAEFYGINGETDHLLQSLAELTSVLKEMRRYMDMQVINN